MRCGYTARVLPLILLLGASGDDRAHIPAGRFSMGKAGLADAPPTEVEVSAFRVDRREVSIADFEAFAAGSGWSSDTCWSRGGRAWRDAHPRGTGALARASGRPGNHPVVAVSFWEAEAYCACAGGALPTEAQWERAACGFEPRPPPPEHADDARVYDAGKYADLTGVRTRAVDDRASKANAWGLVDTLGNVWEWTRDPYRYDSYLGFTGVDPVGNDETPWRTVRGGSYMNLLSYAECSHREPVRPDDVRLTIGFRCVYAP